MTTNIENFSSRESLISVNSALIAQLRDRLKAKRFRPADGDSIKIGYIRVHVHRPPAVTLNKTPEEFHISTGLR